MSRENPRLLDVCEYPELPAHRCEYVEVEDHLRAWYTMSVRLDLHLERNHDMQPSSNNRDWAVQHDLAHESGPTRLEVHPANHSLAVREALEVVL